MCNIKTASPIVLLGLITLDPNLAFAQADTVGSAFQNFQQNMIESLPNTISGVAFIAGTYLVIAGLWSVAKADRNAPGFKHSIYMILCGSAISLTSALLNTDVATVFAGGSVYAGDSSVTAGATENCYGTGSGDLPVTCMMKNVATNVIPIAVETAFVACYFIAGIMLVTTLYGLAMSNRRGSAEPPKNWQMKLIGAGILANVPTALAAMSATLGFPALLGWANYSGSVNSATNILSYLPVGSGSDAQLAEALSFAFVIMSGFGVFYFIGGINMLINGDDNRNTKTKAFVHLLGGTLMANIQMTTYVLLNTLMGINIGISP